MNVDHIKTDAPRHDSVFDRLDNIFMRQHDLMVKYHPIEQSNGFPTFKPPVDLHERHAQAYLKDFAWRVTEEITEATEALHIHAGVPNHFFEELADAYHFLVELSILSGVHPVDIADHLDNRDDCVEFKVRPDCKLERLFERARAYYQRPDYPSANITQFHAYILIQTIGIAMNCLKQKPWKQTHMLTDEVKYRRHIADAHVAFANLVSASGLDHDAMYRMYFKKSEVNKFRQESNY